MSYAAYIVLAAVVGLLIYPVFGHWAWGAGSSPRTSPGLRQRASSISPDRPRCTRSAPGLRWPASLFSGRASGASMPMGKALPIHGHSHVLSATGAMLLLVGWIGFNAGSTAAASGAVGKIAANTLLGASFGGIVAMLIGRAKDGTYLTNRLVNGLLAASSALPRAAMPWPERRDRDWCDLRRLGRFCRGFRASSHEA